MSKICILIILVVTIFSPRTFSQTYTLNLKLQNGTTFSLPIQNINKITFSNITDVKNFRRLNNIVNSFTLLQNHPNPFNPKTTVEYIISKPGVVDVFIFDINGRLVRRFSKECLAGFNKFTWNGRNNNGVRVGSGLYIYTVKFDNSTLSKSMILIK